MRALIWAIILVLACSYFLLVNIGRLPEFGSSWLEAWPFICIVIGILILFRRKGRPKHDFFFNNTKIQKQLEELNRRNVNQPAKQPDSDTITKR
jgi:hypothetical protein